MRRKRSNAESVPRRPLRLKSELRHCRSGKHCFSTEARAQLAAMKYEQEHERKYSVYQCPKCKTWHLTSKYAEGGN